MWLCRRDASVCCMAALTPHLLDHVLRVEFLSSGECAPLRQTQQVGRAELLVFSEFGCCLFAVIECWSADCILGSSVVQDSPIICALLLGLLAAGRLFDGALGRLSVARLVRQCRHGIVQAIVQQTCRAAAASRSLSRRSRHHMCVAVSRSSNEGGCVLARRAAGVCRRLLLPAVEVDVRADGLLLAGPEVLCSSALH